MNLKELLNGFIRHASFAAAWLAGLLCVAERLAPGSVLPYLNIYWLIVLTLVLTMLAPKAEAPPRWRVIGLLPVAFLLIAFLFLVTQDVGRSGLILTAAAGILCLVTLCAMAYREA